MNGFPSPKIIPYRLLGSIVLGGVLLVGTILSINRIQAAQHLPLEANAKAVGADLPENNWRICEDLGVGEVPGVDEPRQRFRLCHNQGWEILAYCLQPHVPAPPLDTVCENTHDNVYWCGNSYQLLSVYEIVQTPTPTNTPSQTPTTTDTPPPSATSTPTPTPSPTHEVTPYAPTATIRPGPGGKGNLGKAGFYLFGGILLLGLALKLIPQVPKLISAKGITAFQRPVNRPSPKQKYFFQNPVFQRLALYFILMLSSCILSFWFAQRIFPFPTAVPPPSKAAIITVRTSYPTEIQATSLPVVKPNLTPTQALQEAERPSALGVIDDGIDFSSGGGQISIQIDPYNSRVNRGKTIQVSFLPGDRCEVGDGHACVNPYESSSNIHLFLTVHSGVGAEGQSFRHALEGTGINRAGIPLARVNQNIKSLLGAEVTLLQDGDEKGDFKLVGLTRIPPEFLETYLKLPFWDVVSFAASLEPEKMGAVDLTQPMLIFETCGWKAPSEPWLPHVTSTTGSIYLGVIQKRP